MLRCYVEEHQTDWDRYASALTYAYNNHVHRSTGTTPFELVLSRPPPFSLHRSIRQRPDPEKVTRHEFLVNLDTAIQRAYVRLKKSQQRYKWDFDARVRRTNVDLKASDYVFIDSSGSQGKTSKLGPPAVGPFRIIARGERTFTIDRGGHTERVSYDRVTRALRPANAPIMVPAPGELEKVTEGPEYTVQRILQPRVAAGEDQLEFQIKWADYADPTWTKRKHIPEELISIYFKRLRKGRNLPKEGVRSAFPWNRPGSCRLKRGPMQPWRAPL